jgi:hypothetical protein
MKPTDEMLAQKNGADKFLTQIRKYTDEVIIAGGFARDWVLRTKYDYDTTINDVDLYVKFTPSLKRWLEDMKSKDICEEQTNGYKGLNNLDSVYKFYTQFPKEGTNELFAPTFDVEFQVIVLNTELDIETHVKDHFDLSICMVTYDGNDFKELPDFTKTLETKIITFNDKLGFQETEYGFKKHVAKITCRFAGKGFKYEGYNPKFGGERYNCKLINRTRLSDKMMEENKWLYKTKNYYYYDENAGVY